MRCAAALTALLSACSSGARPGAAATPVAGEEPGGGCTPRFVGHLISEATNVAIAPDRIYWHEYNFGKIESQPRDGGAIATVLPHRPAEHNSEDMILAGDHLYWSSKADQALYRIQRSGGEPERLVAVDQPPTSLAVAHGRLYAATFGPFLAWVETEARGGQRKSGRLPHAGVTALAAAGDSLYVGGEKAIDRVRGAGDRLERLHDPAGTVTAIAVSGQAVWFVGEKDREQHRKVYSLERLDLNDRSVAVRHAWSSYAPAAVAPASAGGVYFSLGNVVYLAADRREALVPVAIAPADIVDLAAAGDTVVVGTDQGSAHQLCPDPRRPVALVPRVGGDSLACPAGLQAVDDPYHWHCIDRVGRRAGPSKEWYVSGQLKAHERIEDGREVAETFYADGTLHSRRVGSFDAPSEDLYYYANGNLAWKTVTGPGGKPVTTRFDVDGSPRKAP